MLLCNDTLEGLETELLALPEKEDNSMKADTKAVDENTTNECISQILRLVTQCESVLRNLQSVSDAMNGENTETDMAAAQKAAIRAYNAAEVLVKEMRYIYPSVLGIPYNEAMRASCASLGISVVYNKTTGEVRIALPFLSTKGSSYRSNEFSEPLNWALKNAVVQNHLNRFAKALIRYRYHYNDTIRIVPDYDNMDEKKIQDVISTYLLLDDSMRYITTVHEAVNETCGMPFTEIIVKGM